MMIATDANARAPHCAGFGFSAIDIVQMARTANPITITDNPNHHHGQQNSLSQTNRRKFGCAKCAHICEIGLRDKDLTQIESSDGESGSDE